MLENIKITNFALISSSSISFDNGFNVLTGETGAGKSLIVDALLFLTGVRADKTFIKSGQEYSRVEGVFSVALDNDAINDILNSVGLENEGTVIISRQFNLSGKNECRVNGEIVTLNTVRKLSAQIIDIFGQNDSLLLLDSSNHLSLLDAMFEGSLSEYKTSLAKYMSDLSKINEQIKELGGLDKDRENNIRLLEFQIKEINDANLYDGLEEELKNKIVTMQNFEKIVSAYDNASQILDGEYSIENSIKTAINYLSAIENVDSDVSALKERMYSLRYEMQDILAEIDNKKSSVIYSEEELDILQDCLMVIKDLERKYGKTIVDILEYKDKMTERLNLLNNAEEELERLRLNKQEVLGKLVDVCSKLRQVRIAEIRTFKARFEKELKELGMKNANFEVVFNNEITLDNIESIVTINGADELEFLFSANLGVEPRPLTKIISGGEMSRFMLAFKSLQNNNVEKTCIFDEIDAGIGGEIGGVVGKKICEISRTNQVICITHLAQIASFGDVNFKIEKYDENNNTVTSVKRLSVEGKVLEISRMLSGSTNETAISHAKEIIDSSNGYKVYLKNN